MIFIAIVCSGVAVLWGILHFRDSDETTRTKELGRPKAEQPKYSTAYSELPIEQQVAALKKEETELLQAVMRDFHNTVAALEQMGNFLSRHGQRIEAVAFWQKCLAIDPKYFNAHRKLGIVALDRGEYEQALEHYRTAARIRPEAEGIHAKIGEALVGLGRYDEAIREVQEEIRISPQAATAHFLLGQAYLKQKAYEKAQSHYEKALELNPKYTNACYGLARVFVGLKQPDKAKEYQAKFRTFRAEENRSAYDDRNMGTVDYLASARASVAQSLLDTEKLYRGRKDFSRSEALLKRAVTIVPNNSKCFERLGLLYSMTKRYPEALRQFERIREIEPSNPRSHLNVGTILLMLNRYDEAEIAYRKVIAIAPEQSQGYLELARLYLNTYKRLGEARKLAQKAVSLEASPRGYFILSWACDVTGDRNGALKAIEQAIRLEPKNAKYRQAYERIKNGY
ncbi:MAG: tetratricopeptide repeat protein [candidate division Zixibacteria bacterium]